MNKISEIDIKLGFCKNAVPSFEFASPNECKKAIQNIFPKLDPSVKEFQYLKEYDEVANYLSNTKGKGLFLSGDVGRGKSVLAEYVIPYMFYHRFTKVIARCPAIELGPRYEEIKPKRFLVIDDVGTEGVYKSYGNEYLPFVDIVDIAERQGTYLIITTNLKFDEFVKRYGKRTIDRLVRLCEFVKFEGDSLRK